LSYRAKTCIFEKPFKNEYNDMCHMLIYILRKDYFPMTTNYDTTKTAELIGPKFFVGPHVKNKNDKK